jgi:murein DD-endopeptidase MepM/ murein hydrolase activator NlpD
VDAGSGTCVTCGDPCGSATTDQPFTLYCDLTTCACGPPGSVPVAADPQGDDAVEFEDLRFTVENVPVTVGDEIMVILIPAPGALPDSDTSDDTRIMTFLGLEAKPGDSDGDDDGDLLDFSRFQVCFGQSGTITPECTFADLDEDRTIDDQDYDGFDLTGPIFPCQTIGLALNWPFGGQDAAEWVVVNYYDHDPAEGSPCQAGVEDYLGGQKTYDGHNAADINPPNFRSMDNDFPVLAAQEGRVVEIADGNFDRNIAWKAGTKANYVRIRHANGFETRYWHLKKNSILVSVGEWVNAGQPIGVVGSSGYSSGCHLHFGVDDCDGNRLDPFLEGMWLNPPVYNTPLGFMDLWLKDGEIVDINDMKDPTPDVQMLSPGDDLGIGLYTGGGQPGEQFEVKVWRGDDTLFDSMSEVFVEEQCRALKRWWWNRTIDGVTGTWTVQVRINGMLKESKNFTVSN